MKKYGLFIGIDISKSWIDVSVTVDGERPSMANQRFSNDVKGFTKLIKWLNKQGKMLKITAPWVCCMEYTGVYNLALCAFLQGQNIAYAVVSGMEIKHSVGLRRGKSDRADAQDIAWYAWSRDKNLKLSDLPSAQLLELKDLLRYRRQLIKHRQTQKVNHKMMKESVPKAFANAWVDQDRQQIIRDLNRRIRNCEKEMRRIIAENEDIKKIYNLVISVKGIGLITAIHFIVYTNMFKAFENARQFACYCGCAPFGRQSGSSLNQPARVSQYANKLIKVLLTNCMWTALRRDPELKIYYERRLEVGKQENSIQNAIKNKLIARVFAVVKRGTPYVERMTYKS